MSAMVTLQVPGPWRAADLETLPDDGRRYEVIDGVLLVNAAPVPRHQRVTMLLWRLLDEHCPRHLWVMAAPLDVALADDTIVEPDLLVAPKVAFGEKNLPTAPLLAVEVLSPATAQIDRHLKLERYQRAGVASYWLVDPHDLRLTAYELRERRYVEVADVTGAESWTATAPFRVTVTPARLID